MTDHLVEEIKQLKTNISELRSQVQNLSEICSRIEQSSSKNEHASEQMIRHISLVESVYSTVRSPLDFIRQRFAYLTGDPTRELPRIR